METFISIGELAKILNLINVKTKKPLNHVLRYWEKEFKQIKPKIIRNRRYYSKKQIELIKMIKFLLKDKGMTITGVKNALDSNINKLDVYNSHSLKTDYFRNQLKEKSNKLLEKVKRIRRYGKKNTFKS